MPTFAAWLFWTVCFGLVIGLKATLSQQSLFTTDSLSYQNLAQDALQGRPLHLESYEDGQGPVNPWPLAYPFVMMMTSLGGLLTMQSAALVAQVLLVALSVRAAIRLNRQGWVLAAMASDSGLWLLSHAWAEGFFVLGGLVVAAGIQARRKVWYVIGQILMLHARQPALPASIAGFAVLRDKRHYAWLQGLAWVSILAYYIINAHYTGRGFGADRPLVRKDLTAWTAQAAQALWHEMLLVRDTEYFWLGLAQAIGLLALAVYWLILRPKQDAAKWLVATGLGYGLFTAAAHYSIAFYENLDGRLLGPGTVLALAGIMTNLKWSRRLGYGLVALLLLLALPWRSIIDLSRKRGGLSTAQPAKLYRLTNPTWAPALPQPGRNVATEAGVALGKALFFDKRVSGKGHMACANCHRPGQHYAMRAVAQVGGRNSPSLLNVAWQQRLMWDGGITDLESVSLAPLHSQSEMAGSIQAVVRLMRQTPQYQALVKQAFGADSAESLHFLRALAQFQRTLVSAGAPADNPKWVPSPDELLGQKLFMQSCASCHKPPFYTDQRYYAILPRPANPVEPLTEPSNGRYRITQNLQNLGAYKTPSLRNVAQTPPYMHDGSVKTLDGCLHHGQATLAAMAARHQTTQNHVRRALLSYLVALNDTIVP